VCVGIEAFQLGPDGADLLAEVPLCCPSGALLLPWDASPGSGHLLLALASNW